MAVFYGYDMSVADVAATLEITTGAAKTHLHRGRHNLTSRLGLDSPEDGEVTHDDRYVELIADDDSDSRLVVTVPDTVYDPPAYEPTATPEDLLIWTLGHPAVQHSARYRVNQFGWTRTGVALPWQGQAMDLSLRARAAERGSVPLVPPPGAPDGTPPSITSQDETFRWAVVHLQGSDPIVCAAISFAPDGQSALSAFKDLLQSIHAKPSG